MMLRWFLRSLVYVALLPALLGAAGRTTFEGSKVSPADEIPSANISAFEAPAADTSAYELIAAMNTLRTSNGLAALIEDPIINAVAQSTAATMAANNMSWHIGDVRGRLAAAGYGGGATVWATENFATGNYSVDEIMVIWSDADHMIPAVNPAYCHVGAGVARASNGRNYYILQAAYTSSKSCGEYKSPSGPSGSNPAVPNPGVPQVIVPVKIADPDAEGRIFHEVAPGQSLWAIAIAYQVTIRDIETWNNISKETPLKVGQRLFIPGENTAGFATPTPVGMVLVSEPGVDGKVIHVVQPYQALFSIAQAYRVNVDTILSLNGLQVDWPLQIGQELLISMGESDATPTPLLHPLQQLTPEGDGRYYHTVRSGETLTGIARLYEISLEALMAWNGLSTASILYPQQKLALLVTPPPTATATATLTPTPLAPQAAATLPAVDANVPGAVTQFPERDPAQATSGSGAVGFLLLGAGAAGLLLFVVSVRKRD